MDEDVSETYESGVLYSLHNNGVIESLAVSKDFRKAYFWHSSDPDYEKLRTNQEL